MASQTLDGWLEAVDEYGLAAWITLMVLGFILFWPIGLGILAFLIWSGRMGCKNRLDRAWHAGKWRRHNRRGRSSGNVAFDEYREETLRRLEDEQREFADFVDSLRKAKDKAEFDQFMSGRRPSPPPNAVEV